MRSGVHIYLKYGECATNIDQLPQEVAVHIWSPPLQFSSRAYIFCAVLKQINVYKILFIKQQNFKFGALGPTAP